MQSSSVRAAIVVALSATLSALAASNDNNIEWAGVSHNWWQDRRPLCPVNRQAFTIYFQTYRFDIASARVRFTDGANVSWIDAVYDRDRGPYAVWKAQIPASANNQVSYYVELTDGSDVDYIGPSGLSDGPPASGFALDFSNSSHAPVGASYVGPGQGVVFKVWAPTRTQAWVRGQFNNWGTTNPMIKQGDYFVAHVANATPGQMYKYMFNGDIWKSDPRGRRLNPSDNYNTFIVDTDDYAWQNNAYNTPAFEDVIIYQLHTGTFAGRNDPVGTTGNPSGYLDVKARAAHLQELGITAVQFNPFTEFAWDWSAGYNPVSQYAPEWKYGTNADVKALIDELHGRGIAAFLDVVWNQFSNSDNFLWNFVGTQCYYDASPPNTPWGPQPDYDRYEVREYYVHSALQWIEEYRLDGFRFDATDFINQYQGAGWNLMQWANDAVDNRTVDKFLYAEQLPNDTWITRATSLGGAGFDGQYNMQWRDNIRGAIFAAASGDPSMASVRDAILGYDDNIRYARAINYIELHDEAWPDSGGQRMVKTIDPVWPHDSVYAKGRTKLGFGLTLIAPGVPAILQGTEWLEDTEFGSGNPSNNPENRINWQLKSVHARIFDFYKDLIAVRKSNGALRASGGRAVHHVNDSGNVIAFHRWDGSGNRILIVASFSNNDYNNYQVGVPAGGVWYELINSQAPGYDGDGPVNGGPLQSSWDDYDGMADSLYIKVPAMGLLVFRYDQPPNDFLDQDGDAFVDAIDNCPDTANAGQQDSNGDGIGDACDCNVNGVYDSTDIANGTSDDCDDNGTPDECDLLGGGAADCNDNAIPDSCDIAGGFSQDQNNNGVPDECDAPAFCLGDVDCSGTVDFFDIDPFVSRLGCPGSDPVACAAGCPWQNADVDEDGDVDFFDIDPFVATLGNTCQ